VTAHGDRAVRGAHRAHRAGAATVACARDIATGVCACVRRADGRPRAATTATCDDG